jgi:hypothetical protein
MKSMTRSAISRVIEAENRGIVGISYYPWHIQRSGRSPPAVSRASPRLDPANKNHEKMLQGLGVLAAECSQFAA